MKTALNAIRLPGVTDLSVKRFHEKIDYSNRMKCWIWRGGMDSGGYGFFSHNGKQNRAHRISYSFFRGEIPSGLLVCHHCDNPSCVNPSHLFLGTNLDNCHDKEKKGRGNQPRGNRHGSKTKPWRLRRGDRHPRRLFPELSRGDANPMRSPRKYVRAIEIIKMSNAGMRQREIARAIGCCQSTVSKIVCGHSFPRLANLSK